MKFPLSIKTDYLPSWGVYEGLRELIQNGKDAETEFSATFEVRHRKDTDTLVIDNEGCTIPHEALLFGHTSKTGRADMIGKFGEGLKLGVLALVRAGYPVKIRSGSEVWTPTIERSDKFNADVLVFDIDKGRADRDRVQIEIGKITAEDWAGMRHCFLFLMPSKDDRIETAYGSLLLGPKFAGRLYVKGIFVENDPKLKFGYDLAGDSVGLDRDRKMIARWDLEWRTREIWASALRTRKDIIGRFFTMLEEQSQDINGLDDTHARDLPKEVLDHAREKFLSRHGKDAVPVANLADSQEVENLGRVGVVVPKPLKAVLQSLMGTTEQLKEDLKNEATRVYSWGELSDEERGSLGQAIMLVGNVTTISLDEIDIVDFRSAGKKGMFKRGENGEKDRIQLAKNRLGDRRETLATLVHEVSHKAGDDGWTSHVAQMETIWSGIVQALLKPSTWERVTNGNKDTL